MTAPSPPRTLVSDLPACVGSRVLLSGSVEYLHRAEDDFDVMLRDHTGTVPLDARMGVTVKAPLPRDMIAHSAIEVLGVPERTRAGELRIVLERLDIVGPPLQT